VPGVRSTRDPVARVLVRASAWSCWTHLTIAIALVLTTATLDALSGPATSLFVFQLLPLALASWFVSRRAGVGLAAIAGFAWFADNGGTGAGPFGVVVWNCVSRVGLFMLSVWLVSAMRELYDYQRDLASTDELTGVPNRRALVEAAAREIARAARESDPISLVYIDVDHFKRVNDKLGHDAGDRLLRTIAHTLETACRRADLVARLGGDEFAVLLPKTGPEAAARVAGKLRNVLAIAMQAHDWPVTVSIGVASFERPPGSAEEMLRKADKLQYAAKHQGRNSVVHARVAA
jgi:diguanylate cyclase (GGDEF)-like protein